jgi:hypothetical protein
MFLRSLDVSDFLSAKPMAVPQGAAVRVTQAYTRTMDR